MTMPMRSRSIEQTITEQVRRWEMLRRKKNDVHAPQPVITLSRLPGCSGRTIAQELAKRMKFDLFDKELMEKVAESSHLSATMLDTLDDKAVSQVKEWIDSLILKHYLPGDFFRHLSKALMSIAQHGSAVILGRGASMILPPDMCLRVLLVAPLDHRIKVAASELRLSHEDAKRHVIRTESERRAYFRQYFQVEMTDPHHYDIVVNTAGLGIEGTAAAIQAAWEAKKKAHSSAGN